MDIEEKYGQLDLKQFMNGRNHIKAIQQDVNPPEILHGSQMRYPRLFPDELHPICGYRNPNSDQHYGMDGSGRNGMIFPASRFDLCPCDSSSLTKCGLAAISKNPSEYSGGGGRFEEFEEGGDGGNNRWPRHETLTLLDIRSKMDSMFREANQKGPLWEELSRILAEEHGYQRSGKKCREKFENLYKYYKKTKEGKAGRQDGKHYRFFNQLEALYGGTNNCAPDKNPTRLGFKHSDSSDSETSSSHDVKKRRSWKSNIKMFVDVQMKKLVEKQEEWLEKVVETLERKEEERILREEEWRNQETARFDREHKFWANERAWLEARDVALMGALHKLIGLQQQQQQHMVVSPADSTAGLSDNDAGTHNSNSCNNKRWPENRRKTAVETRFQESSSKGNIWDEISNQMDQLGYDRSTKRCKENSVYSSLEKNEKIPEAVGYHPSQESSPTDSNARVEQEDCLRIPISDQTGVENVWESYMFMLSERRIGSVRRE